MSSQVFYRKWRPQTFSEVVGQELVTQTLLNALAMERVAHAYLFFGPRGTGKTSVARILAKAVNCLQNGRGEPCNECEICQAIAEGHALDLIEIDAASNRGIDEIRDLREKVNFAPNIAKFKVYIIDEVHMLTEPAFNALLKTLEEPPPHVIFVLATTEVHKLPPTILSRCQRFDFRRLPQSAIVTKLRQICEQEGIDIEPQAQVLIARSASGSLRDAENLLEQLVIYYGSSITLHQVQAELGIIGDERVRELARCALSKDIPRGLATINSVLSDGLDMRQFHRELVEYLRGVLLVRAGAEDMVDFPLEAVAEMKALGEALTLEEIAKAVKLFSQLDLRTEPHSPLPLELALVDCASVEGEARGSVIEPQTLKEEEPVPVPSPPASPEPILSPTPPTSPDFEYIRSRWNDFVNACRGEGSRGNLDALLRKSCKPLALEGDAIVLGFYWEFQKSKIEDPKYRHLVEKKLMEVFQTPYTVRCVLLERGEKTQSAPSGESPLVQAALGMGAQIVTEEQDE
jgi:DNA polymerase-3 subunit gamma/tau